MGNGACSCGNGDGEAPAILTAAAADAAADRSMARAGKSGLGVGIKASELAIELAPCPPPLLAADGDVMTCGLVGLGAPLALLLPVLPPPPAVAPTKVAV